METIILIAFWAAIFWACWHWFLHNWLKSAGLIALVRGKFAARKIPDEAFFEQASKEIRNGNLREGLWAQAWAEAGGDDKRARAAYIKLRVDAMKAEAARRFGESVIDDDGRYQDGIAKTVVPCPLCGTKLRMPMDKLLDVRCTKCGHEFRVNTAAENCVEEFPAIKDQVIGRIGRLVFLWLWLGALVVAGIIALAIKEGGLNEPTFSPVNSSMWLLIAVMIFNFAILIARFRDADKSGWWSLVGLIPFVYILVVFYLLVVPGTPGRNRFGPKNAGLFVSS